ncbi:MAG: hypothetical protein JWM68_492 [Verrucomicrobiales bacterium]|nr:hypothetical protein [Verrucomicrobiales bacterium]
MDDLKLLRVYVAQDSQEAFRTVVERHLNLVYSTALRKTANATLAEEVAQAVFILLSKKAESIGSNIMLSGWLYRATCYVANDALKAERRRQQREQEVYDHMQTNASEPTWTSIAPLLDDAMATLSESDRQAVLLRFFENKSLSEVGNALRVSDDTAQKRISRALSKLKGYFERRKVAVTIGVVAALMLDHAAQAAPAHLLSSVSEAVWNDSLPVSTATLVSNAATSLLRAKQWLQLRIAFAVTAITIVIGSLFLNLDQSDLERFKPVALHSSQEQAPQALSQSPITEGAPKATMTRVAELKQTNPQPAFAAQSSPPPAKPAVVLVKTSSTTKPTNIAQGAPPMSNAAPSLNARSASRNTMVRPVSTTTTITGPLVTWKDDPLTNAAPPRELQPIDPPRRQPVNRTTSRPSLFGNSRNKRSNSTDNDGRDPQ